MAQLPWPWLLMYLWSSGRIMWTLLLIHVNPSCTVAGEWQSSARNDDEGSVEWRRMFMCFQWTVNLRHVHYKQTSELQNMFPNVNNVRQWRRWGWGRKILRVHISHHWHNCLTCWTSLTFSNTRRWRFVVNVLKHRSLTFWNTPLVSEELLEWQGTLQPSRIQVHVGIDCTRRISSGSGWNL